MLEGSQIFFWALIFYVAGIILGNFFASWPLAFFILLLVSIILAVASNSYLRILFIFLACLFFGLWRFQMALPDYADQTKIYHYNSSTVEFSGQVTEAASSLGWQNLTVAAQTLSATKGRPTVSGKVKISAPLYPEYRPGDVLKISCRLEDYRQTENTGYANYLFKENTFSTCGFAQLRYLSSHYSVARFLFQLRGYAKERINLTLKEPAAAIINGMLLNDTKNIPPNLNQLFSRLGLTHIIAISGSHLVIIIYLLLELLIFFGLNRLQAFWPAVGFIVFYVALVGAPASAVRSAVMAILMMYAQKIGRLSDNKNLLVLAAATMSLFNPKVLLFDVGFQLSFLAVVGLSYFSGTLKQWLKFIPEKFDLREIIAATASAQLLTYPLIIYYFGGFSPYSLLANVLILPIVPLLMGIAILNLGVALVWIFGGQIIGILTMLMVAYWLKVSELLVGLPGSYWQVTLPWWVLLSIYGLIGCGYYFLHRKRT